MNAKKSEKIVGIHNPNIFVTNKNVGKNTENLVLILTDSMTNFYYVPRNMILIFRCKLILPVHAKYEIFTENNISLYPQLKR
jgi:hypothetical protein